MSTGEVDDPSIENDWRLFRRIPLIVGGIHAQIVWNENSNSWEPSSLAFNSHPDDPRAFSVHLEPVLVENGLGPESVIVDPSKFALVAFTAGQVREQKQLIRRVPIDGEPAHAHVIGDKTGGVRKRLKRCAVWVIAPTLQPPNAA